MGFIEKNFWIPKRAKVINPLDKLNEALEMLEKTEKLVREKASKEVVKAKEFTRAKDKRAAIQCLKSKKLYEQQIEQLGNLKLRIRDQMRMLEGGEAAARAVDALRTAAAAMKAMYIRDVDNVIYDINEQMSP